MRWGGWTNPQLRRWMVGGVLLLLLSLVVHYLGGRAWDVLSALISVLAGAVIVVGWYRYQDPPQD